MKNIRRNSLKRMLLGTLLTASLLTGAHSADAAIGISFDAHSDEYQDPNANNDNIVGWSFTANRDLYTTKIAVYDTDRDVTHEPSHFIGLWDSTGKLLQSATVLENGPRPSGFSYHWADITKTLLNAGQTYFVGAIMGKDYYTAYVPESLGFGYGAPTAFGNLQVNADITYRADAFYYLATDPNTNVVTESANQLTFGTASLGNGLNDPNTIIGGFGANIDVTPTPIPAAAWLLGSGLLGLVGIRRKQQ